MLKAAKKTSRNVENFLIYNERRAKTFESVHELHAAGYSNRKIAKLLKIHRVTVATYLNGEFEALCQKDYRSDIHKYHDYIVKSLQSGMIRKDIYRSVVAQGHNGKQTVAYDYMNKVIEYYDIDIAVGKSTSANAIEKRKELQNYDYLTRSELFKSLWMNAEISPIHKKYVFDKYPQLYELSICIKEFRKIFDDNHIPLLHLFIEKYKKSEIKALSHFAKGMEKDIDAIENAVSSSLSNGFVEGTISKLKMIKRVMYGRCHRELLAAKMMYADTG